MTVSAPARNYAIKENVVGGSRDGASPASRTHFRVGRTRIVQCPRSPLAARSSTFMDTTEQKAFMC